MGPSDIETVAGFDPDCVPATEIGPHRRLGHGHRRGWQCLLQSAVRHRIHKVTPDGVLRIVAGTGTQGSSGDGGPATAALIDNPTALAVDRQGNLYIATNTGIRCVSADSGMIRTVIKLGEGSPLRSLSAIAAGPQGFIFAADLQDHRIKLINVDTGETTPFAGNGRAAIAGDSGAALSAALLAPSLLAADVRGNLYYSEMFEPRARRIDASTGTITTVSIQPAGEDYPDEYELPSGLAADAEGNLYVSQVNRCRVLKVAGGDGDVTVFAGTGSQEFNGDDQPASTAAVPLPQGLAADAGGNVFIAQLLAARIRRVEAGSALITTIAGNGLVSYNGDGHSALETQLHEPANVLAPASGDLLITSAFAHRVLKVDATGVVTTTAGGGAVALSNPQGSGST